MLAKGRWDLTRRLKVKEFFAKLRKTTFRVVMSARPSARMEQLGPTGRTFMKYDI